MTIYTVFLNYKRYVVRRFIHEKERIRKQKKTATKINKKQLCTILCLSFNKSGFFDVIYRQYEYILQKEKKHTQTDATIICLCSPAPPLQSYLEKHQTLSVWWISFTLPLRSLTKPIALFDSFCKWSTRKTGFFPFLFVSAYFIELIISDIDNTHRHEDIGWCHCVRLNRTL